MIVEKNIPEVWDKIWTPVMEEKDKYNLEKEKHSIRWKRIKEKVLNKFGSFKNIKSIELGAGQGTYSLLFTLEGADVTVLDSSQKAIDSSKLFFKRYNAKANFITMDALNLDKRLLSRFDVSMSFGTAEHFKNKKRIKFIKTHFDVLKKDGITLICVPNKWNIIYQSWKFLSQLFGRWKFGEEYPFSILEFKNIGYKINKNFEFIGGSLFYSPFLFKKRIKKLLGIREDFDTSKIKNEIGTPLDKYLSVILIAISENKIGGIHNKKYYLKHDSNN